MKPNQHASTPKQRCLLALPLIFGALITSAAIANPEKASKMDATARGTGMTFTDVTVAAGVSYVQHTVESGGDMQQYFSGSATVGDFDGDGWIDLFVTRLNETDILYHNNGDGTFTDVSASAFAGTPFVDFTNGAQCADIDNDGDLDIYVTTISSNRYYLYINDGTGQFTEEAVARGADLSGADTHFGNSIGFGDYDDDGYVDFYVTEWRFDFQNPSGALMNARLFHNQGDANPGHFTDETAAAGVALDAVPSVNPAAFDTQGFAPRFTDLDRDGNIDLILAGDHRTSRLFWNNGDGTFTDGTVAANVGTDSFGMGSTVGDYDGDGDLDWFVTSIDASGVIFPERDGNRLFRNDGSRVFTDVTDIAGVRHGDWGWGAAFTDVDNDGDLDLAQTNGVDFKPPYFNPSSHERFIDDQTRLWINDGTGIFVEDSSGKGIIDIAAGKGLLVFDYDKDGDQDIFITNCGAAPVLYRNDGGNANSWLRIETEGVVSNRDGIGAFITVTVDETQPGIIQVREIDGGSNFLSQNEMTAHFGLGTASAVDKVRIEWPSGIVQQFNDVSVNTVMQVTEPPCLGYLADFTGDLSLDIFDLLAFLDAFNAGDPSADFTDDGVFNIFDVLGFLDQFNAGC